MKAQADCIPCLFRQGLNTARGATSDPELQTRILMEIARRLPQVEWNDTPAGVAQFVYAVVAELTGESDPYRKEKSASNRAALELLSRLEGRVASAADPLDAALRLSAAGNIIDLGTGHAFDLDKDIEPMLFVSFAVDATEEFRRELVPGRRILVLADNAGEIVFDRPLLEQVCASGAEVTVAVKSGPIINDATREDAAAAGIDSLCRVIETGSADIGICWSRISEEFRAAYEGADAILSKGQGNFETVTGRPGNIYFLLRAKCPLVAQALGVKLWDLVFKREKG